MTTAESPTAEPNTKPRFFIVGDPNATRADPRIVARAVVFNIDIREGEREFSATAAAHEIPLLRRKYARLNGSITISKGWVPGIDRAVQINQQQFLDEVKSLGERYLFRTESQTISFVEELYGTVKRDQVLGILKSMNDSYREWSRLEADLLERAKKSWPKNRPDPHIEELKEAGNLEMTDREMEDVIRAADPSGGMGGEDADLEALVLRNALVEADPNAVTIHDPDMVGAVTRPKDKPPAKPKAPDVPKDVKLPGEDFYDATVRFLRDGGLSESAAGDIATLLEVGGQVTDDMMVDVRDLQKEQIPLAKDLIAAVVAKK